MRESAATDPTKYVHDLTFAPLSETAVLCCSEYTNVLHCVAACHPCKDVENPITHAHIVSWRPLAHMGGNSSA